MKNYMELNKVPFIHFIFRLDTYLIYLMNYLIAYYIQK